MGRQIETQPTPTTLLGLIFGLAGTVEEIIEQAWRLIDTGQVRLIGNYSGHRFDRDGSSVH